MDTKNLEARAFPIDDPKGTTLAYASVAIDKMAAIRGIRVIEGKNGLFVTMPQSQDKTGMYRDLAYPLSKEFRDAINEAVLKEYEEQATLPKEQRGYVNQEPENIGRSIDVNVSTKVSAIKDPQGKTLAFASVGLDGKMIIRGIKVIDTDKGQIVSMPQSRDKDGKFRDLAFPLTQELRNKITKNVLAEYKEQLMKYKQSIEGRLAEGFEKTMQHADIARPQPSMAKSSPGLGD